MGSFLRRVSLQLKLLYIQSGNEKWATVATELYFKKLNQYYPFKIQAIKTKSLPRSKKNEKIKLESSLILKRIEKEDYVIIFDEKGNNFSSSIVFSEKFQNIIDLNKRSVVFVIGGSYGFLSDVKSRADYSISLGKLTYNHHVARVVALEQIYRAICIQKKIPYHNE